MAINNIGGKYENYVKSGNYVIAGMGAFDVRYRLRQLVFQCRVVLVHAQQVRILRGVGGAG